MQTYSIVFLDIDGTLLDAENQVPPKTKALLERIGGRVPVVLCSARSPCGVETAAEQAGIHGPIICYNGSLILSEDRSILYDIGMTAESAICFKQFAVNDFPEVVVSAYLYDVWLVDNPHIPVIQREAAITKCEPLEGSLRLAVQSVSHVHKILCIGSPIQIIQLQEAAAQEFPDLNFLRSGPTYLEVTAKGVSKRDAVEKLQTYYQISKEEIVACGDNYVDLEMLRYAGLGIAMGNAPDEVKQAANIVTASNQQGGVYIALKNLRFKPVGQFSSVKDGFTSHIT